MLKKVVIDAERCKGCELCVKYCPKQCLSIADATNRRDIFPRFWRVRTTA